MNRDAAGRARRRYVRHHPVPAPAAPVLGLDEAVARARDALLALQRADGHWLFELEADSTIPAEFILMMHFLDDIDAAVEPKLAAYLRERQAAHGGWPLYPGGAFNISCSVKAYYALKLAGDPEDALHMRRARRAILEQGGAARANVFTRLTLAGFGQLPWRGVPYIPAEIMLLPRWFAFHLSKVSYWSRAVMVPLLILYTYRARAKNPSGIGVRELFTVDPDQERHYFRRGGWTNRLFLVLDRLGRGIDVWIPRRLRDTAIRRAEEWMNERRNGEHGLGAIFPAMVNALEAMVVLGYAADDPRRRDARQALWKLLVVEEKTAYCQPCVSPVWDTALACLALQAEGSAAAWTAAQRGLYWLRPLQLSDEPGDWRVRRPRLAGGGWAFQYRNDHYPDVDDTAVVAWAMHQWRERTGHELAAGTAHLTACAGGQLEHFDEPIRRALDWLAGMQGRDGGFAAFDVDNTHYYLNEIPFADHGALLDPPTADVTARAVTILARAGRPQDRPVIDRAVAWLRRAQEDSGAWFGRWGTNYLYGTWSVLSALSQAGIAPRDCAVRRAVQWLERCQQADGGWGEHNDSYFDATLAGTGQASTPYQTAWALLALAAGGARRSVLRRGVEFLLRSQRADGLWSDPGFTAPGFPRVFYLRYHGYCAYFPLWALARCRELQQAQPAGPARAVPPADAP